MLLSVRRAPCAPRRQRQEAPTIREANVRRSGKAGDREDGAFPAVSRAAPAPALQTRRADHRRRSHRRPWWTTVRRLAWPAQPARTQMRNRAPKRSRRSSRRMLAQERPRRRSARAPCRSAWRGRTAEVPSAWPFGSSCRSPVPFYCSAARNLAPAPASKLRTMSRLLSIVLLATLLGGLASAPALDAGEGPVLSSQAAGNAGAPMAAMGCGACAAMGACIACGPAPAAGLATSWLPPAPPPLHLFGQPRPPEAAPPRRFFI